MFKKFIQSIDLYLVIPSFLIIFLSFFMLSSFQPTLARIQLVYALLGYIVYVVLMNIHPAVLREYSIHLYTVVLLLLITVFFIGEATNGANRWITIWNDTKLQPSEFAKPAIIILLATYFSKYRTFNTRLFIQTGVPILLYLVLIFHQPDFATASLFIFLWGVSIYFTDTSPKSFLIIVSSVLVFAVVCAPIVWSSMHDYQRDRVLVFMDPERDPLGTGYHVLQAMITVGSGEFYGKGFARGTQTKNNFLPEHYTDFAFAAFAEQYGFVGSIIILSLYSMLLYRIFYLARRVKDRFSSYVCLSVAGLLFIQVFVNVGMNTGIVPVAGITLPLFSYGGSSLISFLICLGLVQSVSGYNRDYVTI
jgi:rod shape determining protein RodA